MGVMTRLCGVLLIQTLLLSNGFGQTRFIQNLAGGPQILNPSYIQPQEPLIKSLMSACSPNMPLVEKLNVLAAVIQKLPPKSPEMAQKRIYMAEALKRKALESLVYATNTYKKNQKAESRIPLPNPRMTVANDILANRVVNVRYDRFA